MLEIIFGFIIAFFIILISLAIGAAAGPDNEFKDFYDNNNEN